MSNWRLAARTGTALVAALVLCLATPAQAASGDHPKLDSTLNKRARGSKTTGNSRVIVTFQPGWDASVDSKKLGAKPGRRLKLVNGQVLELPNSALRRLADHPGVRSVHWDRPTRGAMDRTAVTTGARTVQQVLGLDGAGVGVAVIDSGITTWHDDLTPPSASSAAISSNGQRVAAFVDYVNGQTTAYDDHGHGTHVSGIIAGNGLSSLGLRAGVAPAAHVVSLKVLDGTGSGVISNVIAALDFVVQNRQTYNIRVVNVSVGAGVFESYNTDPLTLAAKRATDAGVVVVAAAGNAGKNAAGESQYGAITAPGNAPWVLTVGATSHQGTNLRYDDTVASFSSRGPSRIDFHAKPDLLAPGTGIVSLSVPGSLLYTTKPGALVSGAVASLTQPYLSLSGTSMAAPVVAGAVALMMQANPALTPNLVKAILQYTSESNPSYNALTQGAGLLNAKGAVDLARYFATAEAGQPYPSSVHWTRKIHWGNHRISGGAISPSANAWLLSTAWGVSREADGDNIVWGTDCENESCDNIVWGTHEANGDNIVWGTIDSDGQDADGDNIVWGTRCENESCDNIVWGTYATDGDNIVWGTDCGGENCDNIVWGTRCEGLECGDNIVWGTCDGEGCNNVVWASLCGEAQPCGVNTVSGTSDAEGDNIVWGTSDVDGDNIVWGTWGAVEAEGDNIVWGTWGAIEAEGDNIVWGTSDVEGDNIVWGTVSADPASSDTSGDVFWSESAFEWLFIKPLSPVAPLDSTSTGTTSVTTVSTTDETTVTVQSVDYPTLEPTTTTSTTDVSTVPVSTTEPVTTSTTEPAPTTTSEPLVTSTSDSVVTTTTEPEQTTISTTTTTTTTTTAPIPGGGAL